MREKNDDDEVANDKNNDDDRITGTGNWWPRTPMRVPRRSKTKMYHLWAQKQQLSAVYRGGG